MPVFWFQYLRSHISVRKWETKGSCNLPNLTETSSTWQEYLQQHNKAAKEFASRNHLHVFCLSMCRVMHQSRLLRAAACLSLPLSLIAHHLRHQWQWVQPCTAAMASVLNNSVRSLPAHTDETSLRTCTAREGYVESHEGRLPWLMLPCMWTSPAADCSKLPSGQSWSQQLVQTICDEEYRYVILGQIMSNSATLSQIRSDRVRYSHFRSDSISFGQIRLVSVRCNLTGIWFDCVSKQHGATTFNHIIFCNHNNGVFTAKKLWLKLVKR